MNFVRNASGVLATSSAQAGLGLLLSILLARWLSVDDRGLYAVAMSYATLATFLCHLGIPSATIYRVLRAGAPVARVAGNGLLLALAASLLVVAVSWLLQPLAVEHLLEGGTPAVFLLAVALVPIRTVDTALTGIARATDRFALANGFQLLSAGGALVVLGVVLVALDGGLIHALAAYLVLEALLMAGFAAAVTVPTGVRLRPDRGEMRQLLRFGIRNHLQSVAGHVHERIDVFMLAVLLGDPAEVAFYVIAVGVIERLRLLPESFGGALFPSLASLDPEEAAGFTSYVCRHSLAWVLLLAAVLAVAAPLLLPLLYGAPYAASIPPFLILLPAIVFHTIYRVLTRYFMAIDRQETNIAIQLLSLACNVTLNLLLIPRLGIAGAALASTISYGLEAALSLVAFRAAAGTSIGRTLVPQAGDVDFYRQRLGAVRGRLGL